MLLSPSILVILLGSLQAFTALVPPLGNWDQLTTISNSFSGAWLVIGDFNSITSQAEKRGGNSFASSSRHTLLTDLKSLGLIDLGYHGSSFTWSNKRNGKANIQQRNDRGVANDLWCTDFPHSSILNLPAIVDHNIGAKPFRFEAMWLQDATCFDTVRGAWNK
ncbi:hypothetical protein ABFS83_02G063300 [Erythranthe nasuta]